MSNNKRESGAMRAYRRMDRLHRRKMPIIPQLIMKYIRVIYSCDLVVGCQLGEGVMLMHNGLGVVIHPSAKVGRNCIIYQNVTIGGRFGKGVPVLGDNVVVGAGAKILGGVTIGNGAVIGANSVVVKDIEANTTVVGIPAKELIRNSAIES